MNKIEYICFGFLSILILAISTLYIFVGQIIYGPEAYILAVMGVFFVYSSYCLVIIFRGLLTDVKRSEVKE